MHTRILIHPNTLLSPYTYTYTISYRDPRSVSPPCSATRHTCPSRLTACLPVYIVYVYIVYACMSYIYCIRTILIVLVYIYMYTVHVYIHIHSTYVYNK